MKYCYSILSLLMMCWLSSGKLLAQSAQTPDDTLTPVLYSLEGKYLDEESEYEGHENVPCNVIWEGDSVVWFDNLFPDLTFPDGGTVWIKGVVEYGVRITIHPQSVYHMTMDHDGMAMEHDFRVGSIVGTLDDCTGYSNYQLVNNTRDHRMEPIYKDVVFALYDQFGNIYSAAQEIYLEEVGDALVKVADDAEVNTFLMHYSDQQSGQFKTSVCKIAIKDNLAWVQGLCRSIPDAWVAGTIGDFGTISLDLGQLLGAYKHEAILYFVGVKKAEGTLSKLALAYQSQTGGYLLSPEYLVAEATLGLVGYGAYGDVDIRPYDGETSAPKEPWNLQVGGSYGDFPFIAFQYDDLGSDDKWLVTDSLYYQVNVNDQPLTFVPEDYPSLSEPTDRIPCLYEDGENFLQYAVMGYNSLPLFLLHRTESDWQTVSVRLLYSCFGQELASDYVTLVNPGAGIQSVDSDTVHSLSCDLMGRPLTSPSSCRGFVLERDYESGTVRVSKKYYR